MATILFYATDVHEKILNVLVECLQEDLEEDP